MIRGIAGLDIKYTTMALMYTALRGQYLKPRNSRNISCSTLSAYDVDATPIDNAKDTYI